MAKFGLFGRQETSRFLSVGSLVRKKFWKKLKGVYGVGVWRRIMFFVMLL